MCSIAMPHRVSIGELGENDHSSSELMGHLIIYNPLSTTTAIEETTLSITRVLHVLTLHTTMQVFLRFPLLLTV